jgi:sialic acid synthase SpsE|tara:strand:+ start:1430 stop:2245 length:816 start_codon:yes stop_codon:yes gene_type:complete
MESKKIIEIIAEIGWNHLGDMNLAKKMIKSASMNGATFAKFQSWSVKRLTPGSWDKDGRRQIYEKAELSESKHIELISHCNKNNIKFLSSVFSIADAMLLKKLECESVKIPSFESRNTELIKFCDENFERVFMSCGTSTFDEIKSSLSLYSKTKLTLLHCVSMYPCDYENANINKMLELMKIHNSVGYSDHIQGVESAKIAIGLGAEVIEKHFTIDNDLPGRDNKFAILPEHLNDLNLFIQNREKMFIDYGLDFQEGEKDSRINYEGRFNG